MAITDIFKKQPQEYVELDFEDDEKPHGKLMIQVEKLSSFSDADRIQEKVRNGRIVLVRIHELKAKDIGELKRAVARVRKTCLALDGDIAGIGEDWLLVTPKTAKIHRGGDEDAE